MGQSTVYERPGNRLPEPNASFTGKAFYSHYFLGSIPNTFPSFSSLFSFKESTETETETGTDDRMCTL